MVDVEAIAVHEYREGVSPHRALEELAISLGNACPTLKRLCEDVVAAHNRSAFMHRQQLEALRETKH